MPCDDSHQLWPAGKAELAVPQLQQGCHSQGSPRGGHPCNSPQPSRVATRAECACELQQAFCCLKADTGIAAVQNACQEVPNLHSTTELQTHALHCDTYSFNVHMQALAGTANLYHCMLHAIFTFSHVFCAHCWRGGQGSA